MCVISFIALLRCCCHVQYHARRMFVLRAKTEIVPCRMWESDPTTFGTATNTASYLKL
jgi:hypothetical protein